VTRRRSAGIAGRLARAEGGVRREISARLCCSVGPC